jgi:signal transduction histidine kinase
MRPESPTELARPTDATIEDTIVRLAEVGSAMVVCTLDGTVRGASPSGHALLARTGWVAERLPAPLPSSLWRLIAARPVGEAVEWYLARDNQFLLGCTRYRLGDDAWLLVMSEISKKHREWSQRMHQQRLEALGSLVATTAHDLRSPLASIVFNSDVLLTRQDELDAGAVRETLLDIQTAANRLRGTIDCLLDYVRIGPPVSTEVSLRDVLDRAAGLLRPLLRAGAHHLLTQIPDEANRVRGNALAIEQIFVNLIVNAMEAAAAPVTVRVAGTRVAAAGGDVLRIVVEDDGPGIPEEHRLRVFEPFFTTKKNGTGLGLSSAREAARAADGDLELVRWTGGAAFAVLLPPSPPGRVDGS